MQRPIWLLICACALLFFGCQAAVKAMPAPPDSPGTADSLRYGRSTLTTAGRTAYDAILEAAQNGTSNVTFGGALPVREFEAAVYALRADKPLLDSLTVTPNGAPVLSCTVTTETPARTAQREKEIAAAAAPLLADLPTDLTARALTLHDRLLAHLSYRTGASAAEDSTVYGALVGRVAICDGYSKSYQYLCQKAGIPCYFIEGTSVRGIPHSWNMVLLAQGWRYVDTTWDESSYARSYHDYFLISLEELLKEHTPGLSTPPLPKADGPGYYELCGYSANTNAANLTDDIAAAFASQLRDYPPPPGEKTLFLEIKLTGTQYKKGRDLFQKSLFPIVAEINRIAKEGNYPFLLETDGPVEYNFNNTTQVLTIFPITKVHVT